MNRPSSNPLNKGFWPLVTALSPSMTNELRRSRWRVAGIHLGLSAAVAILAAAVMFKIWYPAPFAAVAGGTQLLVLLVLTDVLLGPVLTCVVAGPLKPRRELIRDLAIIGVLQLAALGYGLYTAALARPVALVLEVDQFRLVTAADVEPAALNDAPELLQHLSWSGPKPMAVVKPSTAAEQLRVIDLELAGIPLATMPRYWRPYPDHAADAWRAARSAAALAVKYPAVRGEIDEIAKRANRRTEELRFLPLRARRGEWVTLLASPGSEVVGHLPLDGFF